MKITDHLVQEKMDGEYDTDILHTKALDVNMRLFKDNERYRKIILSITDYMEWHLTSTFEDYHVPKGVAGPSLGIPFNIIAYKDQQNKVRIYINPKIIGRSKEVTATRSNCGAQKLTVWVELQRANTIDVEFFDLSGNRVQQKGITKDQGGFTIQHEIDCTAGILVTDKRK